MTNNTAFRLPQLADSVTSVRLSLWLKQVGDRVETGESIAEVETDKTNVELEAPVSGVLQAIHVAAGTDGLEPGTVLAVIAASSPVEADAASAPDTVPAVTAASQPGTSVEPDATPDEVSASVAEYEKAGADQVTFGMLSTTMPIEIACEAVDTFGKHVIPQFDKDEMHSTTRQREAYVAKRGPITKRSLGRVTDTVL